MASVADLVEPWVVGDGLDLSLLGRARHLVARGAVVPSAFGPRLVEATVTADEGAELASLRATGSRLDWACSCAAADRRPDDGDPCIHVVATAQVAWDRAPARRR